MGPFFHAIKGDSLTSIAYNERLKSNHMNGVKRNDT